MSEKQGTEALILSAAKKVFLKKGLYGARMQDIADEAGINKALLHYYFRSKEKLFAIIFGEMFHRLLPKIQHILSSEASVTGKLDAIIDSYLDILNENPFVPIFILSEIHKNPEMIFEKFNQEGGGLPELSAFFIQVEQEIRAGKIKPVEPLHLFLNVVSMCVFPFVGKPMMQHIAKVDDDTFQRLMHHRNEAVKAFVRAALTP